MAQSNSHIPEEDDAPHEGSRCVDVLSDTLEGYSGIEKASFDIESGKLKIAYDPRILSKEQAMRVINVSGQQAAHRVMQCRSKSAEQCAMCASAMGEKLMEHYRKAADATVPATQFRLSGETGALDIDLNKPATIGREIAQVETGAQLEESVGPSKAAERPPLPREKVEVILTGLTVVFGLAAFAFSQAGLSPALAWTLWALAFVAGGFYGLIDGIEALKEKKLDVNLLMIFAALGAAAIGQPAEGAALLFLFSLSNTLQSYAMDRSRRAIEKLLDLRPSTATIRRGSRTMTMPVEKVLVGDVALVRPGERLPIDGEVIAGMSEINQAPITGESMPVHKETGDPVFAGSVNGNGGLEVRVTRLAKDTTLARIVQMVEEAQSSKAQTQRMLDNFEQVYALVVLSGAVLLAVIPYFILGHEFFPTFYRAMTWLVVASPCALVISTPASILSAIANGARNGVLFKGGAHLERAATLKVVAFDKTGTLTQGKPQLASLVPLGSLDESEVLRRIAAVEARSEHPLAAAIVSAAHQRGITVPTATETRAIPGQGIEGQVEGDVIWVGGKRLFYERGVPVPEAIAAQAQAMEEQGQTVMMAYCHTPAGGEWLGLLGAADVIRPDAKQMIDEIKKQGIERTVMLTGDNERVAARIAQMAGVDEFHANLLPQDKAAIMKMLREKYGPVAMVGDGVNDAPALATADVGVAMGGAGTDVALETADMVLMSDDLHKLPHAIGLARSARRIVFQNLTFALAVIVLLVISAFAIELPLPLGVVGHEGSTVLVVLNGLRLLAYKL